jgi:hypothetical protein
MPVIRSFGASGCWLVLAGLGAFAAAGCNSNNLYPVHGRLVYEDNGEPVKELADFDVTFTSEKLGTSARGKIGADGSFDLGTFKDKDGAAPGEYIVIVSQPERKPERPYVGDPVVERTYEDPAKSDLKAEVKAESNNFTFKLRRIAHK